MSSIIQQKIASGTLMGWWDFRSGTIDDFSGNAVDASFATGTYLNKEGLNLDGVDDYLTVGTALNVIDDATWTGWIKTTDTNANFISKWDAGIAKRSWALVLSTGRLSIVLSSTGANSEQQNDNSGALINDGIWHHVAVVYDKSANTVDFYVDGIFNEQDNLTTATGGINSDVAPVLVGDEYSGSIGGFFGGSIQELEMFSEKLTATEIAQLMGETADTNWPSKPDAKAQAGGLIDPSESGLVGGWNMKPQGSTVVDLSNGNNNGTIVGAFASRTILGDALIFNGTSDYINLGNSFLDDLTTFTYSGWVYHNSIGTDDDMLNVDTHTVNAPVIIWQDTGVYSALFNDGVATTGVLASAEATKVGVWSHLVVTFEGGNEVRMYINGSEDSNSPFSIASVGKIKASANDLVIGCDGTKSTSWFDGKMANVKMYNEVKSSDWVSSDYEKGANAVEFKTDFGCSVSTANVTAGFLENSPFEVLTGTHKIETDTYNGHDVKVINPVVGGTLKLHGEILADTYWDMYVDTGSGYALVESGMMASNVLTTTTAQKIIYADKAGNYSITKKLGI
uniref:Putative lectin/glucanase superfamily protein n=2 Tax=viral metagenome TaxID=1070528 RepID=A0A6M3XIP8_9ZZZZ